MERSTTSLWDLLGYYINLMLDDSLAELDHR